MRPFNETSQEDDLCTLELEEQDRSFDVVEVKYINPDSMKSIIFIILESSMSQRGNHIIYKIALGANCNLVPLQIFKPFSHIKNRGVACNKNNMVVLNTYNN